MSSTPSNTPPPLFMTFNEALQKRMEGIDATISQLEGKARLIFNDYGNPDVGEGDDRSPQCFVDVMNNHISRLEATNRSLELLLEHFDKIV